MQKTAPGKAAAQIVVSRQVWEAVAGVGFARRTHPTRFDRGTLWVEVASAGWAQELGLVEKVILERLHARGVVVQRLRFTVREVTRAERGGVYAPPKEAVRAAREMELPGEVARAIAKVRDPELRDVITKTARAAERRKAEVALKEEAARVERAIPRVPGSKR
ncbi:MAG: DUF721 domain-containing protein [Deltaproteobacteria bacterium]|nr:DUF721 domain-containing protein [Deltaproteobacteria bacterium]